MASLRPEHLIALSIPLVYAAMVLIEACGSGWRWPVQRGWNALGVLGFVWLALINTAVAGALNRVLPDDSLLEGDRLGVVGGAILGFLLLSLGNAVLHRAYHRYDWLWRHVHQLHHAPRRMGVAGVMLQSPLEMAANALLFVLVTVFLLGLDTLAAMGCAWLAAFYGMFQHFNLRTPVWLGVLIQRPEAHCEHHRRGVHAGNYSDFPLWDLLAGSFNNPREFEGTLGFEPDAGRRIGAMLIGIDVLAEAREGGRRRDA